MIVGFDVVVGGLKIDLLKLFGVFEGGKDVIDVVVLEWDE